jgi:hypothetical protein
MKGKDMPGNELTLEKDLGLPWYRQRWPWLLMSGPVLVVVAGIITTFIAFATWDGLVADDYYKEGLAVNQSLQRSRQAQARGISADLSFSPSRDRVRATLTGPVGDLASLKLRLTHATLAGLDQTLTLERIAPGFYEGPLKPPPGKVLLQIETGEWRIGGQWHPREAGARLEPQTPAATADAQGSGKASEKGGPS